jgi:hypothetical protein
MFKYSFILKLLLMTFLGFNLFANDKVEQPKYNQKAQIILETIQGLEKSGYITSKNSIDAKKEFVFSKPELLEKDISSKKVINKEVSWTEYISLINIMKVLAVIFLLIAFKGVVFKFIILFISIPQYVYQFIAITISLALTFYPELFWMSEAKYLSIFGVVANVVILGWIAATYNEFVDKIFNYISLNVPAEIVASFYSTLYFGFFAIYIDSSLLGIAATMSFVSIFGFTMNTTGLCTYIGYDKEDYINQSLLISLLVVVGYSIITIMEINVPHLEIFSLGIEYVLTIVLVITLIIKTSFAFEEDNMFGFNVFIFVILFIFSVITSFLFNLEVIPSIINTGFLIFLLGWLHYFTMKVGGILTMFVASITFYLSALMLEKYPEYFVNSLF